MMPNGRSLLVLSLALAFFLVGWQLGQRPPATQMVPRLDEADGAGVDRALRPHPALRLPSASSPARGPDDAAVTIVAFVDFECPFSARASGLLSRLRDDYPGEIRLVLKHFPAGFHPRAIDAHRAAIAAGEQGFFWEMHDRIFAGPDRLDRGTLFEHARALELDMAAFEASFVSADTIARIAADRALGVELGLRRTPRFFIGGRPLGGPPTFGALQRKVEIELARRRGPSPERRIASLP